MLSAPFLRAWEACKFWALVRTLKTHSRLLVLGSLSMIDPFIVHCHWALGCSHGASETLWAESMSQAIWKIPSAGIRWEPETQISEGGSGRAPFLSACLFISDRISLCTSGWTWTHNLPASASQVLWLRDNSFFFFFLNWELDPGLHSCCVSTCSLSYILSLETLHWDGVSLNVRGWPWAHCVQSSPWAWEPPAPAFWVRGDMRVAPGPARHLHFLTMSWDESVCSSISSFS